MKILLLTILFTFTINATNEMKYFSQNMNEFIFKKDESIRIKKLISKSVDVIYGEGENIYVFVDINECSHCIKLLNSDKLNGYRVHLIFVNIFNNKSKILRELDIQGVPYISDYLGRNININN